MKTEIELKKGLMTVEELKQAYAKLPGKLIPDRRDAFFKIEENKPVTLFVLAGGCESFPDIKPEGYSSRGVWVHPIGTHFLSGKRTLCTDVTDPNSCFICEQLRTLEENLEGFKEEAARLLKEDETSEEASSILKRVEEQEEELKKIRRQDRFVMNVLVKGKEVPTIYEAPKTVADAIWNMFDRSLMEDGINILDPMQATSFTIERKGKGLNTKYSITPSPRGVAIITGADQVEKIKKALNSAADLDSRYKLPTRAVQLKAWETYLNPDGAEAAKPRPSAPSPLSHVKPAARMVSTPPAPKPVEVESPEVEDDIQYGDEDTDLETAVVAAEEQEVQQEVAQTAKPESSNKVNSLLTRLKAAGAVKK